MLATAAQGVIAQAHVHFRMERAAGAGLVTAAAVSPDDSGAPEQSSSGDPSTCALCQALASGHAPLGHSFDSALALARLGPTLYPAGTEPLHVGAVTHIWTSRGPPLI
jgi:hypothetical protein